MGGNGIIDKGEACGDEAEDIGAWQGVTIEEGKVVKVEQYSFEGPFEMSAFFCM